MNKSGIVLIVIGLLLLAHNFGLLQFEWLRQWWPLLLVALGVWSLINHKPGDDRSPGERKESLKSSTKPRSTLSPATVATAA